MVVEIRLGGGSGVGVGRWFWRLGSVGGRWAGFGSGVSIGVGGSMERYVMVWRLGLEGGLWLKVGLVLWWAGDIMGAVVVVRVDVVLKMVEE